MSNLVINDKGQFFKRNHGWVDQYRDASLLTKREAEMVVGLIDSNPRLVKAEDFEDGTYAAQQAAAVRQAHLDAKPVVRDHAAFAKSNDPRRHGGPADRGSADRYYGRAREPHYYLRGTHTSPLVGKDRMTDQEIAEYNAAYDAETDRKDWG